MLFLPPNLKKLIEEIIVIVLALAITVAILIALGPAIVHIFGQIIAGL